MKPVDSISTEFEVKLECSPELLQKLSLTTKDFDFREVIDDQYLDTPGRDLFRNGVFVRIRNGTTLTVKHSPSSEGSSHVRSTEYSYPYPLSVDSSRRLTETLRRLTEPSTPPCSVLTEELVPFVRIIKERKNVSRPGLTLSLDHVDGLGYYIEVEAANSSGVEWIVDQLDAGHLVNLPIGYVELWLRKHDFSLYQQGRFVLPSDINV